MGIWVGIVGSEGAKFTPDGEARAKLLIVSLLERPGVCGVVSGGCHLGGIDIWAEEAADMGFLYKRVFKPKNLRWSTGYMPRNLAIAQVATEVHCITVDRLPDDYDGMRFPLCYHCKTNEHVKSGGCWTMMQARKMGKPGELHVIEN